MTEFVGTPYELHSTSIAGVVDVTVGGETIGSVIYSDTEGTFAAWTTDVGQSLGAFDSGPDAAEALVRYYQTSWRGTR
jgi:hypothetical protein